MPKRSFALLSAAIVAVVVVAGAAWATTPFVDIAGSPHEANIDAIYNAGITSGCDATHYCPNNPVTRAQMGSFLARIGGLGKNLPKANSRSDRQSFCSMVKSNPASFSKAPCQESVEESWFGAGYSMALGPDGFPVISMQRQGTTELLVLHCTSVDCNGDNNGGNVADSVGDLGQFSSIAIGTDNRPIVSYYDATNTRLKIAHCFQLSCADTEIISPDSVGDVGRDTSIAIGSDGFPVIAYYDKTNGDLKVAHCTFVTCNFGAIGVAVVDTGASPRQAPDDVGAWTSMAIGTDGFPIISYLNATDNTLKVAHCVNVACTGSAGLRTIGAIDPSSNDTSITIGTDGFPVIAYKNDGALAVAHCTNVSCSGAPLVSFVDTGFDGQAVVGSYPSIAIGQDGKPIISYARDSNGDGGGLQFAHCTTIDCSGDAILRNIAHGEPSGTQSSLYLGLDGHPTIAFSGLIGTLVVTRPDANFEG